MAQPRKQDPQQNSGQPIIESDAILPVPLTCGMDYIEQADEHVS